MDLLSVQEKEGCYMNTVSTSNQHENSVTVLRPDSTKIDFCHMPNELIIGETVPATDSHHHIILSIEEARALQSHLAIVLG